MARTSVERNSIHDAREIVCITVDERKLARWMATLERHRKCREPLVAVSL